jgi:hypothetical protein
MNASTKKNRNPSKKSPHKKTKAALVTESHEKEFSGDELIDWMKKFDKQSKQRRKSRDQVLKDLTKNPETFFTLGEPYGYGEEEINIAWSAFRDQPWGSLVSLAEKAEREKLRLTPQEKHADILVQRGLAWKFHDTLLFARSRTWLGKQAPSNAVEMVLIHHGHGWQPSLHLEALACIKLGIPDATNAGNTSGNEADNLRLNIKKRWALAAALQTHSDAEISSQAHFQMHACEDLLKGFDAATQGSSFLAGVRSALNVGDSGRWVRILADAEMLHDNQMVYVFRGRLSRNECAKEDFETAHNAVFQLTGKRPSKTEVEHYLIESKVAVRCNKTGGLLINGHLLFKSDVNKMLEKIRTKMEKSHQGVFKRRSKGRPKLGE